jgi:hypothetical protein
MGIDISVLMGANIASEVAAEKFCETTIGEPAEGGPRPCWVLRESCSCPHLVLPSSGWGLRASYAAHGLPINKLRPVILHGALGRWFNR